MVSIGKTNNIFCYRCSILCIFLGRSFFCCNRCPSLCNAKIFIKSLDIKRKLIALKGGLYIGKTYIFVYLQRRSCCEMNNVKNNRLQFMIHIMAYLNRYLSKIMKQLAWQIIILQMVPNQGLEDFDPFLIHSIILTLIHIIQCIFILVLSVYPRYRSISSLQST